MMYASISNTELSNNIDQGGTILSLNHGIIHVIDIQKWRINKVVSYSNSQMQYRGISTV